MSSGFGAGFGADMLQEILQRKFREAATMRELANREASLTEQGRQANMRNTNDVRRLDQEDSQQGFVKERAGIEDGRYDAAAPERASKIRYMDAQANAMENPPQKPTTQPLIRIGRDGKPTSMGEVPTGAHFINEPAPQQAPSQRGITPTAEANLTTKLATDWQKVSAAPREMDRQFNLMQTGLKRFREGDKNGGSQAVLVTFQKILDPASVVRESEYARSAQGVSVLQRMQGYAQKLAAGGAGVPDAALEEMVKTAAEFTANSRRSAEGQRKRLGAFADKYGIPHELVFDDGEGPSAGSQKAPANETPEQRFKRLGGGG